MRYALVLVVLVVLAGCGGSAVPLTAQRHCSATQTEPYAANVTAIGDACTSPTADGVHAEVDAPGYAIIVVSPEGYGVGDHEGAIVYVDRLAPMTGTVTAYPSEGGWMLSVHAVASDGAFAVTLSGDY